MTVSQSSQVSFDVKNTGTLAATIANIGIGQTGSPYTLKGLPSLPVTLAPNTDFSFTIIFTPAVGRIFERDAASRYYDRRVDRIGYPASGIAQLHYWRSEWNGRGRFASEYYADSRKPLPSGAVGRPQRLQFRQSPR